MNEQETITVSVAVRKPPPGWGKVAWRVPQVGDMHLVHGVWKKRVSSGELYYFCARPLPVRGEAWLTAQKYEFGLVFEFKGERYMLTPRFGGDTRLYAVERANYAFWNSDTREWACLGAIFDMATLDSLCDETVEVLCKPIAKERP